MFRSRDVDAKWWEDLFKAFMVSNASFFRRSDGFLLPITANSYTVGEVITWDVASNLHRAYLIHVRLFDKAFVKLKHDLENDDTRRTTVNKGFDSLLLDDAQLKVCHSRIAAIMSTPYVSESRLSRMYHFSEDEYLSGRTPDLLGRVFNYLDYGKVALITFGPALVVHGELNTNKNKHSFLLYAYDFTGPDIFFEVDMDADQYRAILNNNFVAEDIWSEFNMSSVSKRLSLAAHKKMASAVVQWSRDIQKRIP